ncbi:hypothetical protein CW751_10465 [Brumimicrobium salinarum]|uniref:Secretion system C-terminal sorting domain-containing protein n=1 Tax=Brumimicrobium salinarum TaxID=2058658 RepID=A0A2I0R123_9FLAO|nr:choice-of-anchor J domain-containing protein [Brumimicrobium salinarum]PKR80269.1 hypothetical protein CW751_10465 [Brumimicrobium salinarum]
MRTVLLGFLFLLGANLTAQVSILEENFDNGNIPATWSVIDNDGNAVDASVQEYDKAWIYKEDPINVGNGTASSTSFFDPIDRADRWLISPQVTLGGSGNYISWKSLSKDASFPDSYKVMISTTGNATTDFTDTLEIVSNETPYWSSHTTALSNYNNQSVYFAFVNTTFNGFKLFIDSVYVREQDPLKVVKEEMNLYVYPNPLRENITISLDNSIIEQVQIFNISGNLVKEPVVMETINELNIDVRTLKSGVYFLRVKTPTRIINKKLIKK